MRINLTVYLKDGRELSGSYPYLEVLSLLAWASRQAEYAGFELPEAV